MACDQRTRRVSAVQRAPINAGSAGKHRSLANGRDAHKSRNASWDVHPPVGRGDRHGPILGNAFDAEGRRLDQAHRQ